MTITKTSHLSVFSPNRFETVTDISVTAGSIWCVATDTTYQYDTMNTPMPVRAGQLRGVTDGVTKITFGQQVLVEIQDGDTTLIRDGKIVYQGADLTDGSIPAGSAHNAGEDLGYITFRSGSNEYRVLKRGGSAPVAVPANGQVTLVLSYGQSLSYGSGTEKSQPRFAINPYPANVLMVNGSSSVGPMDTVLTGSDITGLEALYNSDKNETPANGALVHIIRQSIEHRVKRPTFIHASSGKGGKTIAELSDTNGIYYQNAITQATKIKALAEEHGLTVSNDIYVMWVHGESDSSSETYEDDLNALYNQFKTDLQAIYGNGIKVHWFMDQLTRISTLKVADQQRLAATNNADMHMVFNKSSICNRLYASHSELANDDWTHLTKPGYWLQGAYFGNAMYYHMNKGGWTPFMFREATVVDLQTIDVVFDLPGAGIEIDTSLAVEHLGFSFRDNGDADVVVESAQVTGANTVRIKLNKPMAQTNNAKSLYLGIMKADNSPYHSQLRGIQLKSRMTETVPELNRNLDLWACSFIHRIYL